MDMLFNIFSFLESAGRRLEIVIMIVFILFVVSLTCVMFKLAMKNLKEYKELKNGIGFSKFTQIYATLKIIEGEIEEETTYCAEFEFDGKAHCEPIDKEEIPSKSRDGDSIVIYRHNETKKIHISKINIGNYKDMAVLLFIFSIITTLLGIYMVCDFLAEFGLLVF